MSCLFLASMPWGPHGSITWQLDGSLTARVVRIWYLKTVCDRRVWVTKRQTERTRELYLWMRERGNKNREVTGREREAVLKVKMQKTTTQKKCDRKNEWQSERWAKYMPAAERSRDLHFTQVFRAAREKKNCNGWQCAWSAGNIWRVLHFFCLHVFSLTDFFFFFY